MSNSIAELAVLLSIAAVVGVIARLFKQPMILAYLLVGGLVAGLGLLPLADNPLYRTFSALGVTLLLFLVGLEINVTALRKVGLAAIVLGLGQVVITFVGGFFIGLFLGMPPASAAYVAMALTFSSTVIVVKLLSERQDLNSLYGKLTLGILLVQDVVAVVLLVVLAGLRPGQSLNVAPIVLTVSEAILLFGFAYWLGRTIMPKLFQLIARSEELLFLTSIAWVLALAAGVQALGFSIEIGGFLAGISLANSATHFQIASRIRPLRDFFVALFFIVLGSTIAVANLSGLSAPIIIFSLFVLIGNPLIVIVIMGVMGYHRRTSFLTGVTVAQISEFSLILAALGLQLGHISGQEVTVITAVGVITIAGSSYLIVYGDQLYRRLIPVVAFFHRGHGSAEPLGRSPFDRPMLLIGAHRIGRSIAFSLPKRKLTILDSDPDVVAGLKRNGFTTLFGDSSDHDLLSELPFKRMTLVISTMPNFEDNLSLLDYLQNHPASRQRRIVLRAETDTDASALYRRGADYVLQPQLSSGQYLGKVIAGDQTLRVLDQLRQHDQRLSRLTARE
ncbi:MAG: cation:proton antiporter [Patescibacteria group bacterium]